MARDAAPSQPTTFDSSPLTREQETVKRILADAFMELTGLATPTAIAAKFKAEGITGRKNRTDHCPIATYLNRKLAASGLDPDDYSVSVSESEWRIMHTLGEFRTIELPGDFECGEYLTGYNTWTAGSKFIADFDSGKFDELIDRA